MNSMQAPPRLVSTGLARAKDLRVRFAGRDGKTVKAVDGVSFDIRTGETFGVIGESGSGKSTVGRILVCLLRPDGGELLLDGVDPFQLSAKALREQRRNYQIIFQDPHASLDPSMTILQSVREPLDIVRSTAPADRERRALDLLSRVGLGADIASRYPHELSGGQKQRANIARALTTRPRMIVCDEVVAALDVSVRGDVLNLFADLQREFGLTYVFITHDLGIVSQISDRIAVMYLGRFVELAPAEELTERPLHPYTEALLSAEPIAVPSTMRQQRRIVLDGEIPNPTDPPSGCRFRTRCRFAQPICATTEPEWRELATDHWVACHFAGSVTSTAAFNCKAACSGSVVPGETRRRPASIGLCKAT
jgi:oligopeptide/dipeptide ABC transporter ATP-binding protein